MDRQMYLWRKSRLGKFTASKIYLITQGKKGLLKGAKDWAFEKAVDLYYLHTCEDDQQCIQYLERKTAYAKAMQYGLNYEPIAISKYEQSKGVWVSLCPFKSKESYGCTPDGLVESENRLIEVKCPYNPSIFVKYLMYVKDGDSLLEVESKYYAQIQMQLMIMDLQVCDFVAFDPSLDQIHIAQIEKNEQYCDFLLDRINQATQLRDYYLSQILNSKHETTTQSISAELSASSGSNGIQLQPGARKTIANQTLGLVEG